MLAGRTCDAFDLRSDGTVLRQRHGGILPHHLSARHAARPLGRTPRMAARWAKEAADHGDPTVLRVGWTWIAPKSRWREHVKPKPMGRPRRSADTSYVISTPGRRAPTTLCIVAQGSSWDFTRAPHNPPCYFSEATMKINTVVFILTQCEGLLIGITCFYLSPCPLQ